MVETLDGIVEVVRYIGMICVPIVQRFIAFKTVIVTAIEVLYVDRAGRVSSFVLNNLLV